MLPKSNVEILSSVPRRRDPASVDAFHEDRVREDLAEFSEERHLSSVLLEGIFYATLMKFRTLAFQAVGCWVGWNRSSSIP